MATEEEKTEGENKDAPKKGKGKLIIIIAAAVLLIGGGAGAFLMIGGSKKAEGAEGEHSAKEEEPHYATAKLEPFVVNLADASAFAKVVMLIEYDPAILEKASHGGIEGGGGHGGGGSGGGGEAAEGGLPGVMAEREPMIRDAIIRILSSKKPEEVLSPDGKDKLKEELIEGINEAIALDQGPVVNVYFVEFIIQ